MIHDFVGDFIPYSCRIIESSRGPVVGRIVRSGVISPVVVHSLNHNASCVIESEQGIIVEPVLRVIASAVTGEIYAVIVIVDNVIANHR